MFLTERALFNSDELEVIKMTFANSNKNKINYKSEQAKTVVEKFIKVLFHNASVSVDDRIIYQCLRAARYGIDTDSNPMLRYLSTCYKFFNNYFDNVVVILDLIESKKLTIGKDVDVYLKNESLYKRSKEDFYYSALAFNAVIYQKSRYFDISNGNKVEVSIHPNTLKSLFNRDSVDARSQHYTTDNGGWASDTSTYESYRNFKNLNYLAEEAGLPTNYVEVDQKFFFKNFAVSETDEIIPAGRNASDHTSRVIWNYMNIWTYSSGRDSSEEERNSRQNQRNIRTRDKVSRAKDIIKNADFKNKNAEKELLSIIDDLV